MNGKVSKMLRRVQKSNKAGKKEFLSFTPEERGEIRADYKERGDIARENYTATKKKIKKERIGE